jgi:hypothetical protein
MFPPERQVKAKRRKKRQKEAKGPPVPAVPYGIVRGIIYLKTKTPPIWRGFWQIYGGHILFNFFKTAQAIAPPAKAVIS